MREEGDVFDGLADGSVIEWDLSTLPELQRLMCEGHVRIVLCMMACGDLLMSSHGDCCW